MYTLCPHCQHIQQISRKRLKKKHGRLSCPKCKQQFDAYLTLSKKPPQISVSEKQASDTQIPTKPVAANVIPEITALLKVQSEVVVDPQVIEETGAANEADIELFDWQKPKVAYRPDRWLFAVLLGFFLLLYQLYYFQAYSLSQDPKIRPLLRTLSTYGNIPLADYRKPLEFSTIGSSLEETEKGHYRLQLSLINHADFRQPPPYLQLTLQNFYGGIFAQRIFSPQEYLGQTKSVIAIEPLATLDIDFLIAQPEQDTGGYIIELK